MAGQEKEAKLLAMGEEQFAGVERLHALAGVALGPPSTATQHDRYLDTDDFRLHRAGLSLRYRRKEERILVTLKEVPDATRRALLADRQEAEEELPGMPADTAGPPPGEIGARVALLLGGRALCPVADVETRRTVCTLGPADAPAAEVCLDRVIVRDPESEESVATFFEVEVEDRGGGEELVRRAAEELRTGHGLIPSALSKLERALAARGLLARARGEERTFDTTVVPGDRFVDAAYRVFRKHFERMKANEPGTRLGEDAEFLHDMRVSTRRLRAAFRTFGPGLSERRISGHRRHLRRIAAVLGGVRDLDVYLERLPGYAELLPESERDALAPFEAWLRQRREKARRRMMVHLDSRTYAAFLDRFERFLTRGAPKRPRLQAARTLVVEAAPERIQMALDRVLEAGRAIPPNDPSPQDLHRLRILAKQLRYTCEFFSDLYGTPMGRFVKSTVALQDFLGAHQDAFVAGDVLRRFAAQLPAGRRETVRTALALGRLIAAQDLAAAEARRGFRRTFAAFDRKKTRKKLFSP